MTAIDDATAKAVALLKAAEDVVFSFNAMNTESTTRLVSWHPTLNDAVRRLSLAYRNVFTPPPR